MTRYPCARCGKQSTAERMVYSKWTRNRYCLDFDACTRRKKRAERVRNLAVSA